MAVAAVTHQAVEDSGSTRIWLRALPIPSEARVLAVWNRETAISLPWETFVVYWDDFCYPSSDDVFVFPVVGTGALAWNHYEVFEFIENVV